MFFVNLLKAKLGYVSVSVSHRCNWINYFTRRFY